MCQRSVDPILVRVLHLAIGINSSFLTCSSLSLFSPASIRTFKIVCFRFIHESAVWMLNVFRPLFLSWTDYPWLKSEVDSLHGNLSLTSLFLLFPVSQQPQSMLSRHFSASGGGQCFRPPQGKQHGIRRILTRRKENYLWYLTPWNSQFKCN